MRKLISYSEYYQILQCLYSAGFIRLDVYVLILCKLDFFFPASKNSLTL